MGSAISQCCNKKENPTPPTNGYTQQSFKKKYVKPVQNSPANQAQKPVNNHGDQPYIMDNMNDTGQTVKLTDQNIERILEKKAKIKKKIQFDDFQIDGKLGEGGFGVVYLGQLKSNISKNIIEKYAIKKVSKQLLIKKKVYANAIDEKNILAMYKCKFIVALIMAFQDPWFIYFVMECAVGGDTYSLIKKNSPKLADFKALGEKAVRFIAGCVILGLQFLHQNNYMYRDLKPENVLIFENGYVKLTDFGLAKKSIEGELSKTISGTPFYYAPQMVLKKGYNKQIDLWTLGIYLYELSVYEPPFSTEQISRARFQAVCMESQSQRNWKGASNNLSPELKDLIHNLLRFDEKKRLGAKGWQQVKDHAFFAGFDWKALEQTRMESPLKDIVTKFPGSIKPYKPQAPRAHKPDQSTKVEGWTYYKNESM